jgi:hypothetical protein
MVETIEFYCRPYLVTIVIKSTFIINNTMYGAIQHVIVLYIVGCVCKSRVYDMISKDIFRVNNDPYRIRFGEKG